MSRKNTEFQLGGINHLALVCADMRRTIDFYSGVLGMPLLRVSAPVFTGMRKVIKGIFDRVGSFLMILMCLPVMTLAALAIMVDSRGGPFYTQRRVGKSGPVR